MKKVTSIVVVIGLLIYLSGDVLLMLDRAHAHNYRVVVYIGCLVTLAGLFVNMPSRFRKVKTSLGKVTFTLFYLGLLLCSCWLLLLLLAGVRSRPLGVAAVCILFGTIIFLLLHYLVVRLGLTGPKGKPTSVERLIALGLTVEDLNKFEGDYVNEKMPLTINIKSRESTLIAQATNQSAFYLDAISKTEFEYKLGDIGIEFFPEKNELILKQHGGFFPFIKK